MRIPPFWKVYRELDRVRQMIHAAAGRIYEPQIQRRHDRNRDRLLQVRDGQIPAGPRIALFLIFQPRGVSPAVLLTCAHLMAKGYAPLVISNTPLTDADMAALCDRAWKVIVRPNYGYDFGGYRDGILWLQDQGAEVDRLVILNDSIWFPVWPDETMLDRLEGLACDMAGTVIHPAQRRRRLSRRRPAFLESYFYLINRPVLAGPAFRRFWRDYRVSSIKFNAVYRGERSFSGAMEKAGHSVGWVFDRDRLIAALQQQDDAFLRKTMLYGAYTDPEFEAERDRLIDDPAPSGAWRAAALAHIARVLRRRSTYASFPYASFHLMGVPFVKKSRLLFFGKTYGTVQIRMRTQLLRAIDAGDIPQPHPEVLAEMRAIEPGTEHDGPDGRDPPA